MGLPVRRCPVSLPGEPRAAAWRARGTLGSRSDAAGDGTGHVRAALGGRKEEGAATSSADGLKGGRVLVRGRCASSPTASSA